MQRHIRKFVWLATASVVVLSLTIGAVLAHEGRPVGDYRFIVGWLEEPAYEGSRNAVSIRVNKIVEGESEEGEHDTSADQHSDEPEATPAVSQYGAETGEDEDHHSTEGSDDAPANGEGEGSGNHHANEEDSENDTENSDSTAGMTHGEGGHHEGAIEATSAMSVAVEVSIDSVSGVNVQIIPEGFAFNPESLNMGHVDGEGHAHVYVDGVKITRAYTPWVHLEGIAPGERKFRVTLNANSHEGYAYSGEKVEATTTINVTEPHGHSHGPETVETEELMAVSITLEPDPLGGANLFVETEGFTFAPQNAGGDHAAGEGHAHVYVNDVKIGRLYGHAMQLGNLTEGRNKVRVALNSNGHAAYTWNGQAVDATAVIEIDAGTGGKGSGDEPSAGDKTDVSVDNVDNMEGDHGDNGTTDGNNGMVEKDTSRSVVPQGASKPLASIMGQHEGPAVPVEGLEETLRVEITHVASETSKILDLHPVTGEPGHYTASLIPTAAGVYEFRVFGAVESANVDETFVSMGAGGGFDDIGTSAELQFPVPLPEIREIESGVRGALQTAQQAQDAALAAQEGGPGNALALVALIVGIVGAILGAGGIYLGFRARQP